MSLVTRDLPDPADLYTMSGLLLASERVHAARDQTRLRRLIEEIVSDVFEVEADALRCASRGRARIALARQVAMYVAHIGYDMTLTEVGRLFGRDRTTVAHACTVVEQRRDDAPFDEAVLLLEFIVRAISWISPLPDGRRGSNSVADDRADDWLS